MLNITTNIIFYSLLIVVAFACYKEWGGVLPFKKVGITNIPTTCDNNEKNISIKEVFLFSLAFRILMLIITFLMTKLHLGVDSSIINCIQSMQKWDANHYIKLVEMGYSNYIENGQHLFLVFYPAYVWAVRLLTVFIPNTILVGTVFSCLCYAGGCCYIYKLAYIYYGKRVAEDAVLYLSVFPFSFFFGAVQTEGLFLLAISAACYYAHRQKWLIYGLFGILAALTRMTGMLVIVFAFASLLQTEKPFEKPFFENLKTKFINIIKKVPIIFTPLLGFGGYLLLNYVVDKNPFAFKIHQQHWFQGYAYIADVVEYIFSYIKADIKGSFALMVQIPSLTILILATIILFISAIKSKSKSSLLAFGVFYLVANYSLSWLLSAGRYMSCGFVFFIMIANITKNKPMIKYILLAIQVVLLLVYLYCYIIGQQVM